MRNILRLAALLLALLCGLTALAGCANKAETLPDLIVPAGVQADTAAAYIDDFYTVNIFTGSVSPYLEELSFDVDGTVKSVPGYPGKLVEAGEVIVELDMTEEEKRAEELREELAYEEKDNEYADQLAQLEIDMLQVELNQLWSYGADYTTTSLKQLDITEKKNQLKQAQQLREIALNNKRKELEELEKEIAGSGLKAPFAGRVIACSLEPGDRVWARSTVVYLADDSQIYVSTNLASDSILRDADKVYAAIGDKNYDVTPRPMDAETRKAAMQANLMSENNALTAAVMRTAMQTEYDFAEDVDVSELKAGLPVVVYVLSDYVEDALLVPPGAIHIDTGGWFVYVDKDGKKTRREVKTGKRNDIAVQITDGLEEGEIVYVS